MDNFLTKAEVEALCGPITSECATEEELEQHYAQERELIKQGKLMRAIKNACTTTKGRIAVTVYPDHYEVYHRVFFEDMVAVTEDKLEEFLKALLVIDATDKWE